MAAGANELLTPEDVDQARKAVVEADILLVQLEVPMETIERAIHLAHEAGVKVLLNPAPGQSLSAEMLSMVDVLTPNETETQIITRLPVANPQEAETAARQLLAQGMGAAVITLGAKGALIVKPAETQHVPGQQVEVVDTTGAGDAFNGALAVALAEGKELVEAVGFSNAAAALQVTRYGAASAMPYRDEVEALVAS